jgi:lipopolysaccharide biosynthesis glycosyltransferase
MNRIFIGRDPRQPVAATVLAHSLFAHAKQPIAVTMLDLAHLPVKRTGLTAFTYSRYLVPYLCGYEGRALFLDGDMLARADINEIFRIADGVSAVSVVKGKMRFEWPSLMLFNCARCHPLTPGYVDDPSTKPYSFDWADKVGELPPEWNHCVGYEPRNPAAKLVHFTQGIPVWKETAGSEFKQEWMVAAAEAFGTCTWEALMRHSIHNSPVTATYKSHDVATGADL